MLVAKQRRQLGGVCVIVRSKELLGRLLRSLGSGHFARAHGGGFVCEPELNASEKIPIAKIDWQITVATSYSSRLNRGGGPATVRKGTRAGNRGSMGQPT